MTDPDDPMRAYDLLLPDGPHTTPFVFASPHSGRVYPQALLTQSMLSAHDLRSSEDAYVDRLFASAPSHGAPLLAARLPRAWLDVNRAADELDPALIDGQRRGAHNPRVTSGLGVVPRVVSAGRTIYAGKITQADARARIRDVWHPYHARLQQLLVESRARFGQAILLDCHSMPHEALDQVRVAGRRPDIVLGDRFGASAETGIVDLIEQEFTRAGFTVSRNTPFAGAFIAQHYGRPRSHQHVVQVELDRSLYMDEATVTPHSDFANVQARLTGLVSRLCAFGRPEESLAAE